MTLNATPNVNSFILNSAIEFILSSGRFNGPYFTELNIFFPFSNSFFIWLSVLFYCVLLSLITTDIPGVCNFLQLVSLAVKFVVINFLFSWLLVSSICKCVICSNEKNKLQFLPATYPACDVILAKYQSLFCFVFDFLFLALDILVLN